MVGPFRESGSRFASAMPLILVLAAVGLSVAGLGRYLYYRATLVAFDSVRLPGRTPGPATTMELAEIRLPFMQVGLVLAAATLVLILFGSFLVRRLLAPGIRALKESDKRLRTLYESVQAGVVTQSTDGEIVHANRGAMEILELTEEEILGRTSSDPAWEMQLEDGTPIAGEDHPAMLALRTGEAVRHAVRRLYSGSEQRTKWILIDAVPRLDEETGEVVEVTSTFQDITELKKTQEALSMERDRAQRYLDVAEVILIALDAEGRITLINRKGCELLGYREEELIGKSWFETCIPDGVVDEVRGVFSRLMRGEVEPVRYAEHVVVTATGEERTVAWHNAVLTDSDGSAQGTFSSGEDVTEQLRAEEALVESEERFRRIFEEAPLGIALAAPDWRMIAVNPAFAGMLQYEPAELVGRTPFEITHPEDRAPSETMSKALLAGEGPGYQAEKRFVRKDGTSLWSRLTTSTVKSPGGDVLYGIGMIEDISGQKESDQELRRSRERLRALAARLALVREEERESISRELHDELGQTLTGLRMDLSMERSELPEHCMELEDRFTRLIATADESVDLVREISSRLRPPILDVMGLGSAIEWHVDEQRSRTPARFHVEVLEERTDLPEGHDIGVFRIAQEALTNVIRHAEAENVWVELREEGDELVLEVADDGRGIDPVVARTSASLGLLGMQERALAIGGSLSVELREAGGTRVRFVLPMGERTAEEEGDRS